jgi:selenide,water dikinase
VSRSRRLLLVGAGHAHVEVLRRWVRRPIPAVTLTVIDGNLRPTYSGMLPGFVAGRYHRDDVEIDLERLCRGSGIELIRDLATAVDADSRNILLQRGGAIPYDVASLDIGSQVAGAELPGVSEHALRARPGMLLLRDLEGLIEHAKRMRDLAFRAVVVGGGAGGVELAFCLDARLRRECIPHFEISIVTAEAQPIASGPPALSRSLQRAAQRQGIRLLANTRVTAIEPRQVRLDRGPPLEADAIFWVTGPAAQPLGTRSRLPVDPRGFIEIEDTFQVRGQPDLFAVGDCASLPGMAKAGVYAVRAAPLLNHNVRARIARADRRRFRHYQPQSNFLSLLNLGDGSALGVKWGLVVRGRLVMWLKDRIDRRFVARYR